MGRFCALFLVVVAACGDNLTSTGTQGQPAPDPAGTGQPTPVANFAPSVCGLQMWTPTVTTDPTTQLVIAPVPTGAAVFQLPQSGGSLTGFTVDQRMMVATDGTKVSTTPFTSVTMSNVNDRLELAGVDPVAGAVRFSLVDATLSSSTEILKAPGTMTAPMFWPDGARVAVVADASGVTAYHFDAQWQVAGSMLVGASDPAIGLTSSSYGDVMLVGWTSMDNCFVARMPGFATPALGVLGSACPSPRIAGDSTAQHAVLVYQYGDNVRIAHYNAATLNTTSSLLRAYAKAPRVVWDGQRFWISYINGHGDITVGFLDSYQRIHTLDLVGVSPGVNSYELTMINGAPWVVALDATNGYSAHELCVTSTY